MVRNTLSGVVGVSIASLLALGIGGCAGGKKAIVPVQGPVLGPVYATAVDVENWRGSVLVREDPRAKAPSVRAITTKAGKVPKGTDVQGSVPVTAVAAFDGGKPVLRVASHPPSQDGLDVETELRIVVPKMAGANIRNSGGSVEVEGVHGPVMVENGSAARPGGDVLVWTGAGLTEPVAVNTTKGHITLQTGPGTTGRFDLSTDKGRADFSTTMGEVMDARPEAQRYRAVLDGGTNTVALHSGWGNVMARVMPNAGTYVPNAYSGDLGWPSSPGWAKKMGETMKLREPGAP